MELGALGRGTQGRIEAVQVDAGARLRLSELGLRPGAVVSVTHRAAFGGRVVAVGADRFAVDGRTCSLIEVSPVAPPETEAPGKGRAPRPSPARRS